MKVMFRKNVVFFGIVNFNIDRQKNVFQSETQNFVKKQEQKGIDFSLKKRHLTLFTLEKKREFENNFSSCLH